MNPDRHLLKLSSLLIFLLLLAACGSNEPTPTPNPVPQPQPVIPPTPTPTPTPGNTISGIVTGPGDVSNAVVFASTDGQNVASQSFVDASGNYTLADLPPGSYQIVAWKDVNANNNVDNGDYLGGYTQGGQSLIPVTPPASSINITMQVFNDGTTPTPTPDPNPTPGAGISGTVTALPGSDIAGTLVGACPVMGNTPDCNNPQGLTEIAQAGPSAPYTLDVSAGLYVVAAYQSVDGNTFSVVGLYENSQNPVFVSPPASDINFQIEIAPGAASTSISGMGKLNLDEFDLDRLQDLLE